MKNNNKIALMREPAKVYRPFLFQWAHDAFFKQQSMHWLSSEIDFSRDREDYYNKLSELEQKSVSRTLLFFTQMDVEVGKAYLDFFIPYFRNLEIRRMLASFANIEQIHSEAYDKLARELNMPVESYDEFLKYKEMSDKYDYIHNIDVSNDEEMAVAIGIISGALEGFVLYASFALLFYFSAHRSDFSEPALMGVGQIIEWSMRDESHHSASMIRLFLEFCSNAEFTDEQMRRIHSKIQAAFADLVRLETNFIHFILKDGDLEGLTKVDLVNYIKYLADIRLRQMQIEPIFGVESNPLHWMQETLFFKEVTNFFSNTPTTYTKGMKDQGDISGAFDEFK
jgi:ribonucleoside-diphosphate reductase beta chain